MPKLVKGSELNHAQRKHVLAAFIYRWTSDNPHRERAYGFCPTCQTAGGKPEPTLRDESRMACRKRRPVVGFQTDEQWLAEHAFYVNKDGGVSQTPGHCEPVYMADQPSRGPTMGSDPKKVRCEPCLGTGYKGRYRGFAGGRKWTIETCRSCGGVGVRQETETARMRRIKQERAS